MSDSSGDATPAHRWRDPLARPVADTGASAAEAMPRWLARRRFGPWVKLRIVRHEACRDGARPSAPEGEPRGGAGPAGPLPRAGNVIDLRLERSARR